MLCANLGYFVARITERITERQGFWNEVRDVDCWSAILLRDNLDCFSNTVNIDGFCWLYATNFFDLQQMILLWDKLVLVYKTLYFAACYQTNWTILLLLVPYLWCIFSRCFSSRLYDGRWSCKQRSFQNERLRNKGIQQCHHWLNPPWKRMEPCGSKESSNCSISCFSRRCNTGTVCV